MRPKFCVAPKVANSKHSNIEKMSTEKITHAKIIQKTVLIMNGLYLIIFRVNKSLDFSIYLGSVCFYANEGSVDISIFL